MVENRFKQTGFLTGLVIFFLLTQARLTQKSFIQPLLLVVVAGNIGKIKES